MLTAFEAMPAVQFYTDLIFGSGAKLFRAALLRPARRNDVDVGGFRWINLNSSAAKTSSGIKICLRLQMMGPRGKQYERCLHRKKRSNRCPSNLCSKPHSYRRGRL